MQIIDDFTEKVQDFIQQNSRLTVTLIALFVFLFLSGTIVLLVRGGAPEGSVSYTLPPEKFSDTEEFLEPSPLSLTEDYYFSRVSPDKWPESEQERWFTQPTDVTLQELGNANDKLVDKITEAAP